MESLTVMYNIPKDKQTLLFTHIRLAHGFSNHKKRLQAVQARLHAISILGESPRASTKIKSPFISMKEFRAPVSLTYWGGCFVLPFFVVYSNALQESANSILYNGLIEELVDVLQITDKQLVVRNNSAPQSFSDNRPDVALSLCLSQKSCCQMHVTGTYAVILTTWPGNRDVTENERVFEFPYVAVELVLIVYEESVKCCI